jgi:uncharacterized RDD family membrane protein YckC
MKDNNRVLVDRGTRFGQHLIDGVLTLIILISYVFIMENQFGVIEEGDYLRPLGFLILYFIYYIGFESGFGKTPGKFMVGTKVINSLGEKPNVSTAALRTICRFIPFDSISFVFVERGFHDSLSGTFVVYSDK